MCSPDARPQPAGEPGDALRGISPADRDAFMAEATRYLGSSLDRDDILHGLARVVVPQLADWCRIHLLRGGSLEAGHPYHADPGRRRLVEEMERRYPARTGPGTSIGEVVASGQPVLLADLDEAELREAARDQDHFHMLRELGLRSAMIVPMVARDEVVGVLTLAAAESGRRYGPGDLDVVVELAGRAALAVDNARLLEAERRARREAEEASQAKSDFLAVVSHELRTPLNAIIGYEDLLENGISGPVTRKQEEQLGRIRRSAEHLLSLIDELIALSRLEGGRLPLEWTEVDAGELLEEAARLVQPEAEEAGLLFRVETPDEDVVLETDRGRLRQVLLNLLSNAVKYTTEGAVVVSFERVDGDVLFHVRDTGPGIEEEDRERIFEPFTRVRAAEGHRRDGSGLGLAVARRFARAMGGELSVESEPGEGSVFSIRIPVRRTRKET